MRHFAILVVCVLATLGLVGEAGPPPSPRQQPTSKPKSQPQPQPQTPSATTLNEDQIHALAERVIAAQHSDDLALDEFERIEHHVVYSGPSRRVTEDREFRVVPTGTGTLKLLLKENNTAVDPAVYRRQLHDWEQVLEIAVNPDDPRQQAVYTKWQRHQKERKDMVDASRRAFRVSSSGMENYRGHLCDVLQLEPNPSFTPHTIFENVFTGTRAKVWIDDATGQIIHGEADIIRDVSFGAGILGKLYKGGHFIVDNSEISPGLWLPTRVQFDYSARKFLFAFESHEVTESTRYKRVGKPAQALAAVRDELARGGPVPADP